MKCLIRYLLDNQAVVPQHCFYVSMDDHQLSKISLIEMIDSYRKILKVSIRQKIYVLFNEIT